MDNHWGMTMKVHQALENLHSPSLTDTDVQILVALAVPAIFIK